MEFKEDINTDKRMRDLYFNQCQAFVDFLEWLFDTELWYTNQSEMWDKYDLYLDDLDKQKNP